ncbi:hypothetical protein [Bradyrhizobium uaiense]|uniref:Uncharacterized protein n=1 Tax=Bradyrhizobium uaiense TaxID=2594946 RepID=A0A6P1BEG9_9BRAD|nr:hypothetical protein [Bradyrhizobium uaiense]NEU96926.1 hypothetical protein [Bradyrhizobium uaiense]
MGVSPPTLKNTCIKFDIPVPPRGYWAKLQAGKPTRKFALPARAPGMSDEIYLGARYYWQRTPTNEELLGPLGEPPAFAEDISEVRDEIRKIIGKVTVGRVMTLQHRVISRLLAEDEARREKQKTSAYAFSWHKPVFDSPFEQRRLRLLNALFLAVARCGGKPEVRGDQAREISITVHQTRIALSFDRPKVSGRRSDADSSSSGSKSNPLRLAIVGGYEREQERTAWQDGEERPLEQRMSDIAVEIVTAAEASYREGCMRDFEWRGQRKAQLEEELRQRQLELERKERERHEKLAQARIDRLLEEATSLSRAADIRAYVRAVEQAAEREGIVAPADAVATWVHWALSQADRIDPVKNGRFLQGIESDDSSEDRS